MTSLPSLKVYRDGEFQEEYRGPSYYEVYGGGKAKGGRGRKEGILEAKGKQRVKSIHL